MIKLSEHFTLEEATFSETAARLGIDNQPNERQLENMRKAAASMEEVRRILGGLPIDVSSWLRLPEVNIAVGGSGKSAHMDGWGIDFKCSSFGSPLAVAKAISLSGFKYDQLIHEFGRWVHISFEPALRRQDLTIFKPSHPTKPYASGLLTAEQYAAYVAAG